MICVKCGEEIPGTFTALKKVCLNCKKERVKIYAQTYQKTEKYKVSQKRYWARKRSENKKLRLEI